MKNKKLNNGISEIRKITMTGDEKKRIFDNVLSYTIPEKKFIKSPWISEVFVSILYKKNLAFYIIVPLLVVLSSGGIVFASQESLPNSIFYPIKVNVIEPVKGALTFSLKNKAKYESSLARERLIEAEILASQNKLDSTNEKRINKLLMDHTNGLDKTLDKIDKSDSDIDTNEIITNFRAEMNAHSKVLENIQIQKEDKNDSDNEDNKVYKEARKSSDKIRNYKNIKDLNDSDKYLKRKESVELLINNIDKDFKIKSLDDEKEKNTETQKTINEAKKYMEEVYENEKVGSIEEAYEALLDSESYIKEANILSNEESKNKNDDED